LKPNLLVIGASGGVANAFLCNLIRHRDLFSDLILLDRNKKVLSDQYIDHRGLKYTFIHKEIKLPEGKKEYLNILKKHKIDIVLDITDMDSIPIIETTDKAGVSYVNTALNSEKQTVDELVYYVYKRKEIINNAAHILCTGMNPGNVNMWVRYGIEKFGVPKEIIHFEYDTSAIVKKWHPMITWSVHEFLVEDVRDPTGIVLGRDKLKKLFPNALKHRVDMKKILSPILKYDIYPRGFNVLHEENLTIGQKYNIPSRFIYAINIKTMEALEKIYSKKKNIYRSDLINADNTTRVLDGADSIGVILDYPDKKVYYLNSISNLAVIGTNATYLQVSIGIFSALFSLMFDKIENGIHFVEDLFDNHYKFYMFDNMRVQEFVFKKNKNKLILKEFNPEIKLKRRGRFEHLYI
jgi:homospermidine synthase